MTDVEIRPLGPDDDMDAQVDLEQRAFGMGTATEWDNFRDATARLIEDGRVLGAFVSGRPAGAAAFHDMRQWWHGGEMPLAGVAGVKIAPEHRGRGIGGRLMTTLLDLIAERGYPVSALYPATMPIYRSLGWEVAGGCYVTAVPARELRSLMAPDAAAFSGGGDSALAAAAKAVSVRRVGPDDAAAVNAVMARAYEVTRASGPLIRDTESVARRLSRDGLYAYLADDGFLAYRWHNGDKDLWVDYLVAASAETARALWSVAASHSSMAGTVHGRLAPEDPIWWLTRERDVAITKRAMWMLRVVDAPAAIAARGFPPAVELSVPLVIADETRPSNAGRWRLEIADGKGALVPDGNGHGNGGALSLGARGLAALFAGTPVATLRFAGLASGGTPARGASRDDAALDAAFTGTAFMLDFF
ncbi:MAG TPA: GNAT family N-acetyltransferase [Trebonia sp.]